MSRKVRPGILSRWRLVRCHTTIRVVGEAFTHVESQCEMEDVLEEDEKGWLTRWDGVRRSESESKIHEVWKGKVTVTHNWLQV